MEREFAAGTLLAGIQTLAAAGIEEARFEAQLLLALTLNTSRAAVVAGLAPVLTSAQANRFQALVAARAQRIPLAYLRGTQEFYGLLFFVSPAVLIPRPETELLVDFALEAFRVAPSSALSPQPVPNLNARIADHLPFCFADVGTGSGCLLTAILAGCPKATGVAFDLSAEALAIARRNAAQNGVASRARFARGSLLESAGAERFDLIVSNPPYIPTADLAALQPEVRDYEPRMALDGGADGLECLRQLAAAAPRALKPGGWLAVEVGQGQAAPVADLLRARGLRAVGTRRDLAGIERIVYGQWLVARNQRSENVSS